MSIQLRTGLNGTECISEFVGKIVEIPSQFTQFISTIILCPNGKIPCRQHRNIAKEAFDPLSMEGHQEISDIHEKIGTEEKMYIQAEVEMIPEIDENISFERWQRLVELWKKKIISQALPQVVEPHSLDHVLEQYYLNTETPTIDYIYSLSAIGAKDPHELQPILEATTVDELIKTVEELLTVK